MSSIHTGSPSRVTLLACLFLIFMGCDHGFGSLVQPDGGSVCGNGIQETGEDCDDGNTDNTDRCPDDPANGGTCLNARCGDGFIWAGHETCDDGNTNDGDGCSSTCQTEIPVCGNGIQEEGEDCDDGNHDNTDDCPDDPDNGGTCLDARCGDGFIWAGHETCDDSNTNDGDGCSSTCQTEPPQCGNGLVETGEECDDHNTESGDGCDSDCREECGWTCQGQQSDCQPNCGDGVLRGNEECDDNNTTSGDGCSSSCTVECSNGSTTDCNPAGMTLNAASAFVDPDPPRGFIQCAGFINTPQDDVGFGWEGNCLGQLRTLRIKYWDTSGDPWILLGEATLSPECTADTVAQQFDAYDHGGTLGVLDTAGTTLYKGSTGYSCNLGGPPNDYGASDLYFGTRDGSESVTVCSDQTFAYCQDQDEEIALRSVAYGGCAQAQADTDLAIAIYFRTNRPQAGLLLSQVYYDHPSTDDAWEWVQLYNRSACPIDLSTYSLGWGGTSYVNGGTVQLVGTVEPYGCFNIGGPNTDASNGSPTYNQSYNFTGDLQNGDTASDGVALFHEISVNLTATTVPLDAVIYDDPNTNDLMDETGVPGQPDVGAVTAGEALVRNGPASWIIAAPSGGYCPTF